MKLTFIGTGSGKTRIDRFHSSLLFSIDGFSLLVDAGDGVSKALLLANVDFNSIDAILFSHYHADHFGGIASLFTQMKLHGRTEKLKFFTHKSLVEPLVNYLNSTYLFFETAGFEVETYGFEFGEKFEITNDLNIIAKQNNHVKNSHGLPTENVSFVSSGFLFETGGKKIFYTSDVGDPRDLLMFENQKIDWFITETTHVTTTDIQTAVEKLKPAKVFLTHIDEEDETNLINWLSKINDGKYILAEDRKEFLL